jgi:hypothetical protein
MSHAHPKPVHGNSAEDERGQIPCGDMPPASHRRFATAYTAAQMRQIGMKPVPDPERPAPPPRKFFKGKTDASPSSEWASTIRRHYDAAAKEPVPDEFRSLMDEIARKIDK